MARRPACARDGKRPRERPHGPRSQTAAGPRSGGAGRRQHRRPGRRPDVPDVARGLPGRRGPLGRAGLRVAGGPGLRRRGQRPHAARGAPAPEALRAAHHRDRRRARPAARRGPARALAEEIPPEAPAGHRPAGHGAPAKGGFAKLRRLWRWLRKDERGRLLDRALSRDDGVYLAREAARLVARSARHAADARERERHWDAAIGLLDRLCDVGGPPVRRGRACGPSAWRGSRTRPDRARTRADTRRASPGRASSCEARRDAPVKMSDVR
jgi:hypothetical protein